MAFFEQIVVTSSGVPLPVTDANTILLLQAVNTLSRILARLEADARMTGSIFGVYESTDENFADSAS